jgi:uncharacterized protein YbaA (DUF1428 family)
MNMMYVDGYLVPVPEANRQAYIEMAQTAAKVFKECGALNVVECWGDDVPDGKVTSFPMAVKREEGEAVVFSWVAWPSRSVRDEGMKKFMAHPSMQPGNMKSMPFDGQRMIFGGFQAVLDV